jgi:peptidoglycan/xylan/chitin deacetylase (PgdA/CDA1 family)
LFDQYGGKATFFITGNNLGKGEIDLYWGGVINRMISSGHQVAGHTWYSYSIPTHEYSNTVLSRSHQDMSAISQTQLQNQIYWLETAFVNIMGYFPQYMRPPYSSCSANCQNFMAQTGYHIIYFNLDTEELGICFSTRDEC